MTSCGKTLGLTIESHPDHQQ